MGIFLEFPYAESLVNRNRYKAIPANKSGP